MEFLAEYGMFLLKAATIVIAIILAIGGIVSVAAKQKQGRGVMDITSISEQLEDLELHAKELVMSKDEFKDWQKQLKKEEKEKQKAAKKEKSEKAKEPTGKLYVIDFKGSIDAKEVENLREEVTAILTIANDEDEVLVRLESPGGAVHGYGLASSQLARIRERGLKLTIAVDKVAASGGYMMACIGDKIISAPFAYIGSIGVVAQLPNFNKVLKKNDIEFEMHTAGDFKRTLTVFGENDDAGRSKFKEELEEIHGYFKQHIKQYRDVVDIDKVATGEHWIGNKAKELNLVDDIKTSDDFLLEQYREKPVYRVKFKQPKKLADKVAEAASMAFEGIVTKVWSWNRKGLS